MDSYKFVPPIASTTVDTVCKNDLIFIPLDMSSPACRDFLADWKAGSAGTVKNDDGSAAPYSDAAVIALGLTPPVDEE